MIKSVLTVQKVDLNLIPRDGIKLRLFDRLTGVGSDVRVSDVTDSTVVHDVGRPPGVVIRSVGTVGKSSELQEIEKFC